MLSLAYVWRRAHSICNVKGVKLTYLIIDIHDRDNGRVWSDGIPKLVQVYKSIALDWQVRDIPATLLHVATAVQHALICTSRIGHLQSMHSEVRTRQAACDIRPT